MLFRSRIRSTSKTLLFALLFAQAAIVAAACDMPDRAPAQAIAQKSALPCHEEPARNANLCLAHCLGEDQSTDTPQVAIPVWSQAFLLVIVDVERAPAREAILHYTLPHPGAPPPRILYHSFLI